MAERFPPLTQAQIAAYKASPIDRDYFSPSNFGVDFSQPWATDPYNQEARDFFIQHLIKTLQGGGYSDPKHKFPQRYWTAHHIGAALDSHMEHCRDKIRAIKNPKTPSEIEEKEKEDRRAGRQNSVSTEILPHPISH